MSEKKADRDQFLCVQCGASVAVVRKFGALGVSVCNACVKKRTKREYGKRGLFTNAERDHVFAQPMPDELLTREPERK